MYYDVKTNYSDSRESGANINNAKEEPIRQRRRELCCEWRAAGVMTRGGLCSSCLGSLGQRAEGKRRLGGRIAPLHCRINARDETRERFVLLFFFFLLCYVILFFCFFLWYIEAVRVLALMLCSLVVSRM